LLTLFTIKTEPLAQHTTIVLTGIKSIFRYHRILKHCVTILKWDSKTFQSFGEKKKAFCLKAESENICQNIFVLLKNKNSQDTETCCDIFFGFSTFENSYLVFAEYHLD